MRINKIQFEENITSSVGLKEVKFDRLGSVVALIGKNGSGKTRVLNLVEKGINITIDDFFNNNILFAPESIQKPLNLLQRIKDYYYKRKELESKLPVGVTNQNTRDLLIKRTTLSNDLNAFASSMINPNPINKKAGFFFNSYGELDSYYGEAIEMFDKLRERLQRNYIKRVDYSQVKQLQETIADKDQLSNSFETLIENLADNIDYNELGSIQRSSLNFLKKLPHQLAFDWVECMGNIEEFEKKLSYKRYKALKEIFESIIGKSLSWESRSTGSNFTDVGIQATYTGNWKVNEREFNYSEFSEGEKVLFAYVLMFFLISQNGNIRLRESIIIIDEPELHLHPDAEIDLINGIRRIIEDKGQLWIATHSINILSQLNIDEVFIVKEGKVHHPKNTIQREALSELMKIDERVEKLSEFITSISDWTYVHFILECFTNPDVIEIAKADDPQIKSLKELINLSEAKEKKILLDFGAGKGRLFEQISKDEKFNNFFSYVALEPNIDIHSSLISKGINEIYASYDDIKEKKFDFVILCNVLHEIDIDEWVPTLNKVIESLNPDGNLIIIEAKRLTKGEKIGRIGYLLLNEKQIQILFGLTNEPVSLKYKGEYQGITSILLSKDQITSVSIENLLEALKELKDSSLREIEELRDSEDAAQSSNKFGRQAAFLSQQHINAELAFKHIKNKIKKV